MTLPDNMDPECRALCEAMNRVAGIRTIESCCGHGEHPFVIYFLVETLEAVREMGNRFWWQNSGVRGWEVIVCDTDSMIQPGLTLLEARGPVGDYEGANQIAESIVEYLSQ